ncbi:MAG: cell division protein FtsQ/DivIB [Blastocatellia bacterium]
MATAQRSEPRGRAQVVAPRAPRRLQQSRSRGSSVRLGERLKSAAVLVKPAVVLITIALLIVGYNALAGSRLFDLHYINVSQASPALQTEIEQAVKRAVGQTKLLDVNLAVLKEKIEKLPQVRTATVARLLPDGLSVQIVERHPAVLVRRQSVSQEEKLVWLDEDAVEMGEFAAVNASAQTGEMREVPPIAKGFEDGNRSQAAVNADRERIAVYKKLESELGDGASSLWNLIDEIDLRDVKDVNLSLARPHVLIHVGSTDFRKRFEMALTIIQAAKSGDAEALRRMRTPEQRIEQLIQNANNFSFIDTARSDRIVVNFASPGVTQAPVQQETKPTQGKKK